MSASYVMATDKDGEYCVMDPESPGCSGGALIAVFFGPLDRCKDFITLIPFFRALPGGPEAVNNENGESWQYMGPFGESARNPDTGCPMFQFRHRSHPGYNGARVLAIVSPLIEFDPETDPEAIKVTLAIGPAPVEGGPHG